MGSVRNILFIMADQLRADYLGCYGHRRIKTPTINRLAKRGVTFTRAYANATICGPSRMSFYTGRYPSSHGSTWNTIPLRIGEITMGEYLRAMGVRTALAGKTHMAADWNGMARLGMHYGTYEGVLASQCGFEPFERDDGLHLDDSGYFELRYNDYLREHGYEGVNPWHSAANSAKGKGRKIRSGWLMRNARYPAIVAEEHSETAYMTNRAMDFMREAGDAPWCLHLSYIKPHWPYMAPAPYHEMYGEDDLIAANRNKAERKNPHPVFAAYRDHAESRTFAREKVRNTVIPTYMGLIRQLDDHLKRLFAFMKKQKLLDNTLIVFTSDHGDFLGDHWLGEKELFFDTVSHIPLIVVDPDPAADKTRGKKCADLVEAIDLLPTFIEAYGGIPPDHILEGRSLLTYIRDGRSIRREAAISELDYCFRPAREKLRVAPDKARAWMVRSDRWKYIYYEGFSPQLYDLENDPMELDDRGADPALEKIRHEHKDRLTEWSLNRKVRVTLPNDVVMRVPTEWCDQGILIGEW